MYTRRRSYSQNDPLFVDLRLCRRRCSYSQNNPLFVDLRLCRRHRSYSQNDSSLQIYAYSQNDPLFEICACVEGAVAIRKMICCL